MRHAKLVLVLLFMAAGPHAESADLSGTILGSDGGPLPGATVQIYTASVKEGTSPFCPSCYVDCGKRGITNAGGQFVITSLDPKLLFRVLVVADGYAPELIGDVDPSSGALTTALKPIPVDLLTPAHTLRGRVVDPLGLPVVGATVEPVLFSRGTDPLAITNEEGEFVITSERPDPVLTVLVSARGLAPKRYVDLVLGEEVHDMHLVYGATVLGRLMDGGTPVPGAVVGMVTVDRNINTFHGEFTVGTNASGHFEFFNIPPNREYYVYAKRSTVADRGASEIHRFLSGDDGLTRIAETIGLVPGHSLDGRVVLSDGSLVPPMTRLMLGRDDMWDAIFYELDDDGSFRLDHLPAGEYSVSLRVNGYRLSLDNHSLHPGDGLNLVGSIDSDIDGLTILLEPGKSRGRGSGASRSAQSEREQWEQVKQLKAEPLQGVNPEQHAPR